MLIPNTKSRVQFCMDHDLVEEIERIATKRHVPRSHLIECAVRTFLYGEVISRPGANPPVLELARLDARP